MSTSITLPAHLYAHTEVNINDNTIRTYTRTPNSNCKILAVFTSPKGEDRVMHTVEGGLAEFDETYGVGPYSIYGQPLLNARAAAATGDATLQCMRITAPDATYANNVVWVQYKATAAIEEVKDDETGKVTTPAQAPKLQVRFVASPFSAIKEISTFEDNFKLAQTFPEGEGINAPTLPDDSGWKQMPFIGVISKGRGTYGDSLSFRISNNPRADKSNVYKNYYLRIFEGTRTIEDPVRVTLTENAIINNKSLFMEEVINGLNNGTDGSPNIRMKVNTDVLRVLYELYTSDVMYPDTHLTENAFDAILGIDKVLALSKSADYTAYDEVVNSGSGMAGFEIVSDAESTQFNTMTGIKLSGGSDGAFAVSSDPEKIKAREKAIRIAYYKAFMGETNRDIMSPTKFPLDAVFDADFPIGNTDTVDSSLVIGSDDEIATRSIKGALAYLVETRHEDCFCFMDLNTDVSAEFVDRESAYEYANELDDTVNWWNYSIDAYYGKIRDPYNKKVITVSSTYNLSINYPKMWRYYNGKHIPYAGSKYGIIDQFIPGTVFPVFDVDLDSKHLDKLTDQHINYAQIDAKGNIIRGSQSTRYPNIGDALVVSNLSEINNALIILDIKKDAIKLVANYAYNFNEAADIALFNRDAEEITRKYAEAQVKSITAQFSRTDEEAELGILHLTITVVHKALVKINLIDIDVNRAVTES